MHFDIKANWTSSERRLPDQAGQYLVIWKSNPWDVGESRIGIAYFSRKTRSFGLRGRVYRGGWYSLQDRVAYWMPLPELPKNKERS